MIFEPFIRHGTTLRRDITSYFFMIEMKYKEDLRRIIDMNVSTSNVVYFKSSFALLKDWLRKRYIK